MGVGWRVRLIMFISAVCGSRLKFGLEEGEMGGYAW